MERQSSFGSEGSAYSSATKIVDDATKKEKAGESLNTNSGLITALFGTLFTLAKEKFNDSARMAVATVIVDFLLILAIFINLEYPWAVDPKNPLFKVFYMLEVHKPLSALGYKFYTIVFYMLSAMLFVSVAICVWVAWCFKNDSFQFLWPIKFVRVVASLFFGMFYIAALNIYLVMIECAPEHGTWYQHVWHKECLTMPHLIHAIVAIISSLTFATAALLLVIADHELDPMSKSLLAAPHSMTELKAQLAKTVITVVDVLLWGFPRVQGVVFLLCTAATLYFHVKQLPYYTTWMNSFRVCFFSVHAWVALHLCLITFLVDGKMVEKGKLGYMRWEIYNYKTAKIITDSMAYGVPAVFFGGGLLVALRLWHFFRVGLKFQILQQQPNLYSKRVHRFSDEKDVEVVARVGRVWDEDGNVDHQALDLAEVILRAGIQQFPKSPYLHIVYSNLLIETRQQMQSGWAQLEQARHMPLNLSYRFSIFTREQEHKQKAAVSSSGESAADLVSYVEFQRNYRLLQSYHKAALVATREFWRLLLRNSVNLNSLTRAFRKIEQMERLADKTYKVVLERYPKAVKLLRSYANFLETVKNDPWTAAQYYSEAEKQEEAAENAENDLGGEDGLNVRNSAIITINAQGIIQLANKHALKMLGYAKGELDGKNVSVIMPQPFSARHNGYLRNFVTTGKAKILDSMREVVALHRDRYVFPVRILVTKTQGTGADATFMGMLKEVESDANTIRAWLMPNGVTLCADQSFTDYAGWAPQDLIGKHFTDVCVDPEAVNKLFEEAGRLTEEELAVGAVQADAVLRHKFAEEVPVHMRVEMGGTSDQRLLLLSMTRMGETASQPMVVFDHHGMVLFANGALCTLIGTKPKDLRGRNISSLLPQPFGYLHHRWIKDAEMSIAKPPPFSCRAAAVHSLVSSNGVHVPVRMTITSHEASNSHMHVVRATRVTAEEALDEQRMQLTVDQHGHILSVSAPTALQLAQLAAGAGGTAAPAAAAAPAGPKPHVFGFAPENLMGRKLHEAVDLFAEWHEEGHSVMHAVKALGQRTAARPGSAWRVGVMPHMQSHAEEKEAAKREAERLAAQEAGVVVSEGDVEGPRLGRSNTLNKRRSSSLGVAASMRRSSSLQGPRSAIMQVIGPEHTPEGSRYTVRLWRPEMLSGVLELTDKGVVVKADAVAGLIFGVPGPSMSQQQLSKFLRMAPQGQAQAQGRASAPGSRAPSAAASRAGTTKADRDKERTALQPLLTMESLLGSKNVKGGMKGKAAQHKTGPRRVFEARHADGQPLTISLQVALKNGSSNTRLMAAIKPLNHVYGSVAVLHAVLYGEDLEAATVEAVSPSLHRVKSANAAARRQMAERKEAADKAKGGAGADADKVPRLALGGLGGGEEDKAVTARDVVLDPLATTRTDGSALITARDVGLDFGATPRDEDAANGVGPANKQLHLHRVFDSANANGSSDTPNGSGHLQVGTPHVSDDSAMARGPGGMRRGLGLGHQPSNLKSSIGSNRRLSKRHATREWNDVLHVDPDEVPLPDDAEYEIEHHVGQDKDMAVSSSSSSSSSDSDGSSSSEEVARGGRNTEGAADKMTPQEALERKRTMATLEPQERVQYLHGVRRVKEWLASGYHFDYKDALPEDAQGARPHSRPISGFPRRQSSGFPGGSAARHPNGHAHANTHTHKPALRQLSKVDEEPAKSGLEEGVGGKLAAEDPADQLLTLDGLAADLERENTLERMETAASGAIEEEEEEAEGEGDGGGKLGGNLAAVLYGEDGAMSRAATHAGSVLNSQAGSQGTGGGGGGGMNRGRRLKRLLKLLSGQKVSRGVSRLRTHILVVLGAMLLVHAVCFLLLIIFINKQKTFITEISAAGEAIDRAFYVSMYARAAEAATRGAGHQPGDLPAIASRMAADTDRLEYLHQGLYLGFKGLKRSPDERLTALWDAPQWKVTQFYDTRTPTFTSINATLWNLGGDYISAAREVAFYAANNRLYVAGANGTAAADEAAAAAAAAAVTAADAAAAAGPTVAADVAANSTVVDAIANGTAAAAESAAAALRRLLQDANATDVAAANATGVAAANATAPLLVNATANATINATTNATANATVGNITSASPPPPSKSIAPLDTNVTLPLNRNWLFVRANVGEALYTGYLRVLNTLLLLAQDNISSLKLIIIVLLTVEGCVVCFGAIGYVFWLLWKASRARAALFTVFLVVPQGQVRTLASRHISTKQDDDDDSDDGDGAAKDAPAEAESAAGDGASLVSGATGATGAAGRRSFTGRRSMSDEKHKDSSVHGGAEGNRSGKGIKFNEQTEEQVHGTHDTVMGRIKRAISGDVTAPSGPGDGASSVNTRRFHTRKRLTHTTSDIKRLVWPFFVWGAVIVIIYLVSYLQFAGVEESLIDLKMFERSLDQASRTMHYVNELALEQDPALRPGLQSLVREEASWLDTVYSTMLYGGPSLEDGAADGAHDTNTGSLFARQKHADMLFGAKGCMRDQQGTCFGASDPFYQVSRHAIDPMVRRLMREATLMGLDALEDVNHTSSRWQYVWRVAQVDLHDGLESLVADYRAEALAAFTAQGTLHTVVFAVSWVVWALFLWLLLKPYVQMSSTETKRVAELLSQLPPELDVEAMVEESWLVVADTQLDKSGLSVWDPKHTMASAMAKSFVSVVAAARRWSIGVRPSVDMPRGALGGKSRFSISSEAAVPPSPDTAWRKATKLALANGKQGEDVDGDADGMRKGMGGKGGYGLGQEDGDDGGKMSRGVSGGMASTRQVSVVGSSLFAPGDTGDLDRAGTGGKAGRRRPSYGKASPDEVAAAMGGNGEVPPHHSDSGGTGQQGPGSRPGSASVLDVLRRGSMDRERERRGSLDRKGRNKVVPLSPGGPAPGVGATWLDGGALPSGAEPRLMPGLAEDAEGGASRPLSPLLDLPINMGMAAALPPVAEDGEAAAAAFVSGRAVKDAVAAAAARRDTGEPGGEEAGGNPYTRPMSIRGGTTREFGNDVDWLQHDAERTRRCEARAAAAAAEAEAAARSATVTATEAAVAAAVARAAAEEEEAVPHESDELVAAAAGSRPVSRGSSMSSQAQLLPLLPPPALTAVAAANASTRQRLDSAGGRAASPLVPPGAAPALVIPMSAASGGSGVRVVDRRGSLDAGPGGAGSRPMSPAVAAVAAAMGQGGGSGLSVVARRMSLDSRSGSGRPGSGPGLSPRASGIAMPPPPPFSRPGSGASTPKAAAAPAAGGGSSQLRPESAGGMLHGMAAAAAEAGVLDAPASPSGPGSMRRNTSLAAAAAVAAAGVLDAPASPSGPGSMRRNTSLAAAAAAARQQFAGSPGSSRPGSPSAAAAAVARQLSRIPSVSTAAAAAAPDEGVAAGVAPSPSGRGSLRAPSPLGVVMEGEREGTSAGTAKVEEGAEGQQEQQQGAEGDQGGSRPPSTGQGQGQGAGPDEQ